MTAVRLSKRGQVTIPNDVRDRLGLRAGDEVEFVIEPDGYRLRKRTGGSRIAEYRGYLKHLAGCRSDDLVEEMRGR